MNMMLDLPDDITELRVHPCFVELVVECAQKYPQSASRYLQDLNTCIQRWKEKHSV